MSSPLFLDKHRAMRHIHKQGFGIQRSFWPNQNRDSVPTPHYRMNTTFPLVRHLLSMRAMLRNTSGALLVVCTLVGATAAKAKADYTFTLVADSAGPFSNFYFPSPSLNATGTVAFAANLDSGRLGIFAGNGGSVTTIALAALSNGSFGYPSINQAGTVAFFSTQGNGVGERIVSGNGGPLTTIADTAGQFRGFAAGYSTAINASGTVAFSTALDTGPAGIFSSSEGVISPILVNSASLGSDGFFTMNDFGAIAFRRGNGTAVAKLDQGLLTPMSTVPAPSITSAPHPRSTVLAGWLSLQA